VLTGLSDSQQDPWPGLIKVGMNFLVQYSMANFLSR